MANFLLRVTGFLSIPVVLILLIIAAIDTIDRKVAERRARSMHFTNVFMGDSHISFAVDVRSLEGSINMAKPGEKTGYSYHKLRSLLESGSSIQNVYLGFAYHNIAESNNTYLEKIGTGIIATDYFYLHTWPEKMGFMFTWAIHSPSHFRVVISKGLDNIIRDVRTYDGEFIKKQIVSSATRKKMDERILKTFLSSGMGDGFAYRNMEYLAQIHKLCKSKGVRLILVNTPIHPYFRSKIPGRYVQRYDRLIDSLRLEVMDLSRLFHDDTLFTADGYHVSYEGARITTRHIGERLKLMKAVHQQQTNDKATDSVAIR